MSESGLGALLIALMFLFFAMGLEISISMGVVGVLVLLYLKGWTVGLGVVGSIAWSNATSFSFIAVPLSFIDRSSACLDVFLPLSFGSPSVAPAMPRPLAPSQEK